MEEEVVFFVSLLEDGGLELSASGSGSGIGRGKALFMCFIYYFNFITLMRMC